MCKPRQELFFYDSSHCRNFTRTSRNSLPLTSSGGDATSFQQRASSAPKPGAMARRRPRLKDILGILILIVVSWYCRTKEHLSRGWPCATLHPRLETKDRSTQPLGAYSNRRWQINDSGRSGFMNYPDRYQKVECCPGLQATARARGEETKARATLEHISLQLSFPVSRTAPKSTSSDTRHSTKNPRCSTCPNFPAAHVPERGTPRDGIYTRG